MFNISPAEIWRFVNWLIINDRVFRFVAFCCQFNSCNKIATDAFFSHIAAKNAFRVNCFHDVKEPRAYIDHRQIYKK